MKKTIYTHNQPVRNTPKWPLFGLAIVLLVAVVAGIWIRTHPEKAVKPLAQTTASPTPTNGPGTVIAVDQVQSFTAAEAQAESRQNYAATAPIITTGASKITFHYRSTEVDGTPITVYGRAYLPDAPHSQLPVFAFAPGTTGIGDQCAASVEQPAKANWGNYDSHMLTYASQGYAAVITDYEGMRDPNRLHHYMVGPLEGRAVLDSIRALAHLDQAQGRLDMNNIFVAGYSQGGHAAFWADTIAASYAPDISLKGVIGYGPVLSVQETMNDVTRGSILNWFGPYVLVSYADYYHHNYNVDGILQARWANGLTDNVLGHCVDTMYGVWGHDATRVYTPAYLSAIQNATVNQQYPELAADLRANATGTEATPSAKLINHGHFDNVVLPGQSEAALPTMCQESKGPVKLTVYPNATHFNTMVVSLSDTLAWMKQLRDGAPVPSSCAAN